MKEVLIIKTKYETKANEYEIKGDTAYLKLQKKNNSVVEAKLDAADLDMVLAKGNWFAEWNKVFNSHLVQTSTPNSKEKQSLHAFILGVHSKTPIRHINGDTLDNRRCNIEVFDQNKGINDYVELDAAAVAIILRDKYGREMARAVIDKEDLNEVLHSGHTWVHYLKGDRSYAVSNSIEGRVYLHDFLMPPTENTITKHVNNNTLNNKKSNLKVITIEERTETE